MNACRVGSAVVAVALAAGVGGAVAASTLPVTSEPPAGSVVDSSLPIWSVPTDPAAADAAVRELVAAAWAGWDEALRAVDDPAVEAGLTVWFDAGADGAGSAALATVTRSLGELRASDVRLRAHPTIASSVTVETVAFPDPASLEVADVTVCVVGAFEEHPAPAAAASSSEPAASSVPVAATGERVFAARQVWHVVATADGYRVGEITEVGHWPDATTCPPPETTTTVDPVAAEEAAVRQAAIEALRAELEALIAVGSPESMDLARQYVLPDSEEWISLEASIQTLRDEGWSVRRNSEIPESVTPEVVVFGDPPSKAVVTVCHVDSAVVFLPPADTTGEEVLINDLVVSSRADLAMQKDSDGLWKLTFITVRQEWDGGGGCPAAGS